MRVWMVCGVQQGGGAVTAIRRVVEMEPFGKARPRVTRRGTFMPDSYVSRRDQLRWLFGKVEVDGLVHLSVTAVRPMPKSWSRRKREQMRGRYAKPKPDIDNIIGACMDSLFEDDDIVISVFGEKIWGDKPGLIIEVAKAGD